MRRFHTAWVDSRRFGLDIGSRLLTDAVEKVGLAVAVRL
jgi:hypothetical protein